VNDSRGKSIDAGQELFRRDAEASRRDACATLSDRELDRSSGGLIHVCALT
jgi:hypothetical protein